MSLPNPSAPDELLLRELAKRLSTPGRDPTLSVGIVGSATHAPQPPAHCLRMCLGAEPHAVESRGCPFLAGAARNEVDPELLCDGRCSQGFRAIGQPTTVNGDPAVLLTVEGQPARGAPGAGQGDLLDQLDSAAQLVDRVAQIIEENAGFANEVLQNYEQFNLIFDLTQQIAQVTDARAIERLLLQRVACLLACQTVCVVTPEGERRVHHAGEKASEGPTPAQWVNPLPATRGSGPQPVSSALETGEAVDFVRRTRQAHVCSLDGGQVIAGPLVRLDDKVDVVLAVRPAGEAPFNAGDMMLIESVLAFGGQIISNSELHERLRRMSIEVTRALVAAIDKKDHYTSGHSERGGFLTRLTAQELGVSPTEQQIMEWAGLLHDVGKIGIPEEILNKPGKLTTQEFEIVKQHPRMGYEILKPIASFELILDGVLYHHEYPDGSGYPEGLAGDQIPLVARIIHVVDTFDALTSTRAYRQAFSIEQALDIIREEKGVRIDAQVAEAFFRAFEAYRRDHSDDFAAKFSGCGTGLQPVSTNREHSHAQS